MSHDQLYNVCVVGMNSLVEVVRSSDAVRQSIHAHRSGDEILGGGDIQSRIDQFPHLGPGTLDNLLNFDLSK